MAPRQIALRRAMALAVLLAAFALLAARLAWIQGVQHRAWASLAARYHESRLPVPARRGMILDRNGVKLAVSLPVRSVFAEPRAIQDKQGVARVLARVLKLDERQVLARLQMPRYFCWIKRHADPAEAEEVDRLGLPGVGFRREARRVYPNGPLAAHVLGFVGIDQEGLAGIEQKFERALAGRPGFEMVLRDGCGRTLAVAEPGRRAAVDGSSVVLTLDSVVQQIVEEELRKGVEKWQAAGGAAVVLEPATGQVLALASFPTFDPNRYAQSDDNARLNRAVSMLFEPGSTFKPFVASSALDANLLQPDTEFFCHNGAYNFNGRILHDVHGYGTLSLRDIIVKSSNIGIAQVGQRLGRYGLHQAAVRFGFGRVTGIELPGEEAGILRPAKAWTRYSITSIPIGQEIAVTAVGLAAAYNVFGTGGKWMPPRLALGLAGNDGRRVVEKFRLPAGRSVLGSRVADLVLRDFLLGVVERGTARSARVPGYQIGGKTGTAQVARKDARGYEPDAYISTFVGIAPVSRPQFLCLVMIERPKKSHFGGTVAAPVVGAVLERALSYHRVPREAAELAMK